MKNISFYLEINNDFYCIDGFDSQEIFLERIVFENNQIQYAENYISITWKDLIENILNEIINNKKRGVIMMNTKLLDALSDFYNSKNCDDLEPEWIADFLREELNEMAQDLHKYNGDPHEYYEGEELGISSVLFLFSCYFKYKIALTEKQQKLLDKIIENFRTY